MQMIMAYPLVPSAATLGRPGIATRISYRPTRPPATIGIQLAANRQRKGLSTELLQRQTLRSHRRREISRTTHPNKTNLGIQHERGDPFSCERLCVVERLLPGVARTVDRDVRLPVAQHDQQWFRAGRARVSRQHIRSDLQSVSKRRPTSSG